MIDDAATNNRFCVYELIRPRIASMRLILVNCLLRDDPDISDLARRQPGFDAPRWLRQERYIASLAMANIEGNVRRLVQRPEVRVVHLSELNEQLVQQFNPDAIVLSGTYRDFDLYHDRLILGFCEFIRRTPIPVLAICGGHQLVGQAYGAEIVTLDGKLPSEKRTHRLIEYQYRFVKITEPHDPIFAGLIDQPNHRWQRYTQRRHLLRVWQNHGLQLDRLPAGFTKLARGYLAEVQMMVKRDERQLIYGVQFHLEKSFQDWQHDNYWDHRNESRDGRLLFENFLVEALRFGDKEEKLVPEGVVAYA